MVRPSASSRRACLARWLTPSPIVQTSRTMPEPSELTKKSKKMSIDKKLSEPAQTQRGRPVAWGITNAKGQPTDKSNHLSIDGNPPKESVQHGILRKVILRCCWSTLMHAVVSPHPRWQTSIDEHFLEVKPALEGEEVVQDYDIIGLTLRSHLPPLLRPALRKKRLLRAADLEEVQDRRVVRYAGIVSIRQKPETAMGTVFISLEERPAVCRTSSGSR